MAGRKHIEPEAFVPEALGQRDELEGIPEVGAAFSEHLRIVGDPRLQHGHEGGMRVQAQLAAQLIVEPGREEQSLESADVVHVGVGQIDRPR